MATARGKVPVFQKRQLEVADRRPFDPQVGVAPARSPATAAACSSQILMPPVKPIRPSQTTILRCVRKFTRSGRRRAREIGLNRATSTPAFWSGRRNRRPSQAEPIASTSRRTSTPLPALSHKQIPESGPTAVRLPGVVFQMYVMSGRHDGPLDGLVTGISAVKQVDPAGRRGVACRVLSANLTSC